jgi:UDP-glucose 4-epimerase
MRPSNPSARTDLRDARVLVTGASGFIGAHLCEQLIAEGARLVTLRRPESVRSVYNSHSGVGAQSVSVALTDRAAVNAELERIRPDLIFHLAGYVSGDRSAGAMRDAFDGNVLASANLLFGCAEVVPDARVVISTSLDASDPWTMRAETGSPYGISKLQVEILAGGMRALHGLRVVSARVGMTYGPNDPNRQRLVPAVIEALLDGVSPHLSSGRRRCDWIHVRDVVAGLLALGTAERLTRPSLDIGTGQLSSIRGVAESIRVILQAAPQIQFDAALDRPHDQERAAEFEITERECGWRPRIALEEGLRETVRWHCAARGESVREESTVRPIPRESTEVEVAPPAGRARVRRAR